MFSSLYGLAITVFIFFVIIKVIKSMYINRNDRNKLRALLIQLIISVLGCIVAYPICDSIHMLVAAVLFVPCLFSCIKEISVTKKQGLICIGVSLSIAIFSIVQLVPNNEAYKRCELNNFEGLYISENLESNIKCVDEYILQQNTNGTEVKMLDKYAAVFFIPMDKYNKNFDMLLVGNLGSNSIENLLAEKDNVYLVPKDSENLGYQAYFELVDYVKRNYKKIDEVLFYDVYEYAGEK